MIAEPPLEDGAVNVTVACALPSVAVPMDGAPGTAPGLTEFEAEDAVLVPAEFVAVTVNVYAVPFVRPVTAVLNERDHTVTAKDGSFKSPNLGSGATYKYTFKKAGKFSYGCSLHPRMKARQEKNCSQPPSRSTQEL